VPPHAHIGEFALVVVDHAGGINARKFGRTTGTLDVLTKNFLGNGRTTDVAETNEENFVFSIVVQCVIHFLFQRFTQRFTISSALELIVASKPPSRKKQSDSFYCPLLCCRVYVQHNSKGTNKLLQTG
jgi:hypothetical protein